MRQNAYLFKLALTKWCCKNYLYFFTFNPSYAFL